MRLKGRELRGWVWKKIGFVLLWAIFSLGEGRTGGPGMDAGGERGCACGLAFGRLSALRRGEEFERNGKCVKGIELGGAEGRGRGVL
jgi:hypothetical protein